MTYRKPGIILIGAGRFGVNHLKTLKKLEGEKKCIVLGVVDIDENKLLKIAENYPELKTSTNLEEMLDKADAVDIVTPASTHYKIAKICLEKGKHIFVEKPIATGFREAEELVSLARKRRRILAVGHIYLYSALVHKAKKILDDEALGCPLLLQGYFVGLKNPREDVGVTLNYAVHNISIFNYFIGSSPVKVASLRENFLGREYEDYTILLLKYPNGVFGRIEVSWMPTEDIRKVNVTCENGCLSIDLKANVLKIFRGKIERINKRFKAVREEIFEEKMEVSPPLELELNDFIESIKSGREPLSNSNEALKVMKVIDDALKNSIFSSF